MEKEIFKSINKVYTNTIIIKKSEFITSIYPINSVDDANNILDDVRKQYYDANHNCYAYILNNDGCISMKFSDDGEPSGTAGIIMLDVLKKNNLVNILVIVTRYFGGIKLGANGLVRAYSDSTSSVIKTIDKFIVLEEKEELCISFDYEYTNEILNLLKDYEEISKEFFSNVKMVYNVPKDKVDELKAKLVEITKNNIKFM